MKQHFIKALAIYLILLAMPMKQYGQQPYEYYAEEGIILNFHEIEDIDLRLFLLYNLEQNNDFTLTPDVENGAFIVTGKDFETFYNNIYTDFALLSKEDRYDLVFRWKESVSPAYFASIMMDVASRKTRNDNDHCIDSDPFCTSETIQFEASSSTTQAEYIPDKGCLGMTYNPSWFHMRIRTPGQFIIHMEGRDPNNPNTKRDIDYCIWGPFTHPTTPCTSQLTTSKIIDCSYSGSYSENAYLGYPGNQNSHGSYGGHGTINYHVPEEGEYYILLITNFSCDPCIISFTKTAGSGPGETDCDIVPAVVSNTGPYCVGQTIQLHVNEQEGASYSWTGPNFTSTSPNPTRPNCTMNMAGTYTCVTTIGSHSTSASTEVEISPMPTANFTATTVCKGEDTQFTSTSTTNPSGQQITSYQWDFGDGQSSTQENPSHQYSSAGNYNVSLTVKCGTGHRFCSDTKTQSVTVLAMPVANAGEDQTIDYGTHAQLNGSGGGNGFSYQWQPSNKVVDEHDPHTQTIDLFETQDFTLTVTNPQGQCVSEDEVTILVRGQAMTATANATDNTICQGETTQLYTTAVGGTGTYSYSWSPAHNLSDPLSAEPYATPTESTTYTCVVSDGVTTLSVSTTITVNMPEHTEFTEYICRGTSYNFYETEYSDEGDYTYTTTTSQGCEKTITLHLKHFPTYTGYSEERTTYDSICHGYSYYFHGHPYNTTGTYYETLSTTEHGCDSVVCLKLFVYPENDTIIDDRSICESQSLTWHGNEYNHDGDYAYYDSIDPNGCLQVVKLELTVGNYQMGPEDKPRICYSQGEPKEYTWTIPGQDFSRTYYQDTRDEVILPDPEGMGCDVKYRLDLKFHEIFYQEINIDTCDFFHWDISGEDYTESTTKVVPNNYTEDGFHCEGSYVLNLTVNHSYTGDTTILNQCNQYHWQFGWDNESYPYDEQGEDTRTIDTRLGCDSTVTMKLQLDYSPTFPRVSGKQWVIGGSEFQYTVEKYWIDLDYPRSTHKTTWSLYDSKGNPFKKWDLVPYDNDDKCYLYIYTFERDSIELRVHTESTGECECGQDDKSLWIYCGYHDVEENIDPCTVDIFPNPNDGNMTLSFDNLMGETQIKIYNITGTLCDQFTVHNGYGHQNYIYESGKLSPGIYFFNIINSKGILTKKVIIID